MITKDELIEYRKTMNNGQIAKLLNKSQGWVEKKIQEYGIQVRPYYPPTNKLIARHLLKDYLKNHSQIEAAKHFGCALKTIQLNLKKNNLINKECKYDIISKEDLEKLNNLLTYDEIATYLNVPRVRILEIFKIYKLEKVTHRSELPRR